MIQIYVILLLEVQHFCLPYLQKRTMDQSYITNHLGEERNQYFQAVSPPVIQSSNFAFTSVHQMRESIKDELNTPLYTRGCNPTVAILRKKIAALAGGEDALVLSSGSAAVSAAVTAQVSHGDHIICVAHPYGWTNKLLDITLKRFNVTTTFIDGKKVEHFKNAIQQNTKLIILESPNSITYELQDIKAVATLAKQHNITTIIDNSYASPIYQKPLEMGIDISVHSATKYLAGHSDVVAGVIIGSEAHIRKIFQGEYMTFGAVISPNDAWLMLRSLRTLSIRLQHITQNTEEVVSYLKKHSQVKKMYYPFDEDNPQYNLAKQQMTAAPGLFSIEIKATNIAEVEQFVDALKLFHLAVSWGGYESLVFPLCVLTTSENYSFSNRPFNLIRFSVGLDNPKELIKDLDLAFSKIE